MGGQVSWERRAAAANSRRRTPMRSMALDRDICRTHRHGPARPAIRVVQRFPGSTSIGPNLDVYAVAATYSDGREISLAKGKFRLRNDFVSPGTLARY